MKFFRVTVPEQEVTVVQDYLDTLSGSISRVSRTHSGNAYLLTFRSPDHLSGSLYDSLKKLGVGTSFGFVDVLPLDRCRPLPPGEKDNRRAGFFSLTEMASGGLQLNSRALTLASVAAVCVGVGVVTDSPLMLAAAATALPIAKPILAASYGIARKNDNQSARRGLKVTFLLLAVASLAGMAGGVVVGVPAFFLGFPSSNLANQASSLSSIISRPLAAGACSWGLVTTMRQEVPFRMVGMGLAGVILPSAGALGWHLAVALVGGLSSFSPLGVGVHLLYACGAAATIFGSLIAAVVAGSSAIHREFPTTSGESGTAGAGAGSVDEVSGAHDVKEAIVKSRVALEAAAKGSAETLYASAPHALSSVWEFAGPIMAGITHAAVCATGSVVKSVKSLKSLKKSSTKKEKEESLANSSSSNPSKSATGSAANSKVPSPSPSDGGSVASDFNNRKVPSPAMVSGSGGAPPPALSTSVSSSNLRKRAATTTGSSPVGISGGGGRRRRGSSIAGIVPSDEGPLKVPQPQGTYAHLSEMGRVLAATKATTDGVEESGKSAPEKKKPKALQSLKKALRGSDSKTSKSVKTSPAMATTPILALRTKPKSTKPKSTFPGSGSGSSTPRGSSGRSSPLGVGDSSGEVPDGEKPEETTAAPAPEVIATALKEDKTKAEENAHVMKPVAEEAPRTAIMEMDFSESMGAGEAKEDLQPSPSTPTTARNPPDSLTGVFETPEQPHRTPPVDLEPTAAAPSQAEAPPAIGSGTTKKRHARTPSKVTFGELPPSLSPTSGIMDSAFFDATE